VACWTPHTGADIKKMLDAVGEASLEELFKDIPGEIRLAEGLKIKKGQTEAEVLAEMKDLSEKNMRFSAVFRGAGAYRHYIPPVVGHLASRSEFLTAYTPYQAEISQGILQAMFEYQTMICELLGMDAANASVYDGAAAACEGVFMCEGGGRKKVLAPDCIHPRTLAVLRGYIESRGLEMQVFSHSDGRINPESLGKMAKDAFAIYFEQPNYFGQLEDSVEICKAVHDENCKAVMGVNPVGMALFSSPGEAGADIAVGEGQPLGLPLSFGGPGLGFMACKKQMLRRLPGRIVGQTVDVEGRRAFVLTLQAREQHIRREKASSNICSNEAHCALTAAVYLAAMGPEGLRGTAQRCMSNAHYLANGITRIPGFELIYGGCYFHEFVTACPMDAQKLMRVLAARGILGGLPLSENRILWCATEMNTKGEMDELLGLIEKEAL
jgi:glycine dehydrogenase subunit 1